MTDGDLARVACCGCRWRVGPLRRMPPAFLPTLPSLARTEGEPIDKTNVDRLEIAFFAGRRKSAEFSDFLTPLQIHATSLLGFRISAFGSTLPPPSVQTSFVNGPLED